MADNRLAQLSREYSHRGTGYVPTRKEIQDAINVGTGKVPYDVAYGETPLKGGFDIGEVGGVPINATDFLPADLGANALAKLAMLGKGALGLGMAGMTKNAGNKLAQLVSEDTARNLPKTEYEIAHEVAQRNAALPVEQGGLGLHPDNTAMDRAKAMGFDTPAYHGSEAGGIEEFKNLPAWVAENPAFASEFSNKGSVYPLLLNTDNVLVPAKGEKKLSRWATELKKAGIENANPVDWAPDYGKYSFFDLFPHAGNNLDVAGDGGMVNAVGNKYPIVKGGNEVVEGIKSGNVHAVFNPSNIRSRFAAFDPMQRNSANILAGGIGGAVGLNALYGNQGE